MGAKFMRRDGIHPARGTLPRRERPRAGNARPYTRGFGTASGRYAIPPTSLRSATSL